MTSVSQAFQLVPRQGFLPDAVIGDAHYDVPLPIGFGQTNSQPSTVRQMLEWLKVEPGQKVLDVGSGSGWATALLSKLVSLKGYVYAVENIPELVEFGRNNCTRSGVSNARFFRAGKTFGLQQYAPYDRILVSASAHEIPAELLAQLSTPGIMVIPVRDTICVVEKDTNGDVKTTEHIGYVFVPLVDQ